MRVGAHYEEVQGVEREGGRQGAERVWECVWELTMRIFREYSAKELAKVLRAREGAERVGQCVWVFSEFSHLPFECPYIKIPNTCVSLKRCH